MEKIFCLETGLGRAEFRARATCDLDRDCNIELSVITPSASLPPGMSVEQLTAILLKANSAKGISKLDFHFQFISDVRGGAESGQYLEALSWESSERLVVVGTEDSERLSSRMPKLKIDSEFWHVDYLDNGLGISLPNVPANVEVGLHFIVAENPMPEPVDCSAWYAVDFHHSLLLDQQAKASSERTDRR